MFILFYFRLIEKICGKFNEETDFIISTTESFIDCERQGINRSLWVHTQYIQSCYDFFLQEKLQKKKRVSISLVEKKKKKKRLKIVHAEL